MLQMRKLWPRAVKELTQVFPASSWQTWGSNLQNLVPVALTSRLHYLATRWVWLERSWDQAAQSERVSFPPLLLILREQHFHPYTAGKINEPELQVKNTGKSHIWRQELCWVKKSRKMIYYDVIYINVLKHTEDNILSRDSNMYSSTETFLGIINITCKIHLGDRCILGQGTQKTSNVSVILKISFNGGNMNVQ